MKNENLNTKETANSDLGAVMDSYNDGILFGIRNCNAEYQVILQEIYTEFNNLKRINKGDMVKILMKHSSKKLGEDVNPFLEEASE